MTESCGMMHEYGRDVRERIFKRKVFSEEKPKELVDILKLTHLNSNHIPYSCKQKHVLLFRKSEILLLKVSITNMLHFF